MQKSLFYFLGFILLLLLSFTPKNEVEEDYKFSRIKRLLGFLDSTNIRKQENQDAVDLGQQLFFDKRLSKKQNISCGSCHIPENGFGDTMSFSIGTHGDTTPRHTPHLINLVYGNEMFWDGRAKDLGEQFKMVLTNEKEMDLDFPTLIERLQSDTAFKIKYAKAFNSEIIEEKNLIKAMVAFEESITSFDSRFDKFAQGNYKALSQSEIRGLELFIGKAKCITCHKGANFTDNEFHNTGTITKDEGRQPFDRIAVKKEFEMRPYPFFASFKAFKTPSLRNISKSAPYFHDASEPNLKSVLEFYNQGGRNPEKTGLAKGIEQLGLSQVEIDNIIDFLHALDSDPLFLKD